MQTIKELVEKDTDYDIMVYEIAKLIGVVPKDDDNLNWFRDYKYHWCSRTNLHKVIEQFIFGLEDLEIIGWDGGAFSWNEKYKLNEPEEDEEDNG